MTLISLKNVSVQFPIYGGNSRSFKNSLINIATGGHLAKSATEKIIVRALNDITFDLAEGDRVGLVGHNGSGKSTLLRVLAGIYEPTSGVVKVKGRVTSMLSLVLGMDMEATGLENIFMRGYLMGVPRFEMQKKIDEIVDFSGIGNYLHLPMRTYSSGMAMRLAFSISTSIDADIILMDEWLSVGDSEFVKKAEIRLDSLVKNARILVIASHNLDIINNRCNKIINLQHGSYR